MLYRTVSYRAQLQPAPVLANEGQDKDGKLTDTVGFFVLVWILKMVLQLCRRSTSKYH
jgi:hypothetical protein